MDGITDSMAMSFTKLWEMVKDREAWHAAVHRVTKSRTGLGDWTATPSRLQNEADGRIHPGRCEGNEAGGSRRALGTGRSAQERHGCGAPLLSTFIRPSGEGQDTI